MGKRTNWPPLLNFASVVRNAISHDGKVFFQTDNPAPSQWYQLSYSYADHGKKIIGEELEFGDLLLLMFELSDELDKRNCPINP